MAWLEPDGGDLALDAPEPDAGVPASDTLTI
jgi:hypothetical protein